MNSSKTFTDKKLQYADDEKKTDSKKWIILVCGGVVTAMNLFVYLGQNLPGTNAVASSEQVQSTETVVQNSSATLWKNPEVSFYDKWFCRGDSTSTFCNHSRYLHPFKEYYDAVGTNYPPPPPHKEKVVEYRYSIK